MLTNSPVARDNYLNIYTRKQLFQLIDVFLIFNQKILIETLFNENFFEMV